MNPPPDQASERLEAALYRKITLRLMPFLFLCYVVAYVNRVNVSFAKLQMQQDLGMSEAVYGLGAGLFFVGYFFFNVPSNMVLKKIGARGLLGPILIVRGILSAWMMFVHGPTSYYVLRFIGGAVEAGFFPGVVLYFTFWYTRKYLGKMMALFFAAVPLSGIFAGPLLGWMLKHLQGVAGLAGWQWLFLICGIPCSLVGVGVWLLLTNDPERATWLSADEKRLVLGNLQAEQDADRRAGGAKSKLSDAFRNGSVWLLCFVDFGVTAGNYGIAFYLPQAIKNGISKDPVTIGWLSAIPWVVTTIAMLLVGHHSDKTGERRWHLALSCFVGAVAFAVSALPGVPGAVALAALSIATAAILCALTVFWAVPSALLAGTAAAAGIAWINAVANLAGYVSPHAIGIIVDHTHSMMWAMLAMSGAMLVSSALTLIVTRKGALHQ
jgi:sugar phosphate permease